MRLASNLGAGEGVVADDGAVDLTGGKRRRLGGAVRRAEPRAAVSVTLWNARAVQPEAVGRERLASGLRADVGARINTLA